MITGFLNVLGIKPEHVAIYGEGPDARKYTKVRLIRRKVPGKCKEDALAVQQIPSSQFQDGERGGILGDVRGFASEIQPDHCVLLNFELHKVARDRLTHSKPEAKNKALYLHYYLTRPNLQDPVESALEADYIIRQSVTQEERYQGKRGHQIGTANITQTKNGKAQTAPTAPQDTPTESTDPEPQEAFSDSQEYPF